MACLRVFFVSAVWLGGAILAGQITPSARHQATGVVVDAATGEPLRKALVTLQTPDGQSAAFTDAAGHFAIDNVPDGQYGVQCQKPGFFNPAQVAGRGWTPSPEITVSATTEPITIKLAPAASINGRVVDDQGLAIENATVQLSLSVVENGRRRWMAQRSSNTDEDGNYELDNLQPGTYRLHFDMHPVPPFATGVGQTTQSKLPHEVYPLQYYPQAPDSSSAQLISLRAGQTERADFTVKPVPGFRVRGVVSPATMGAFIRVEDSEGNDTGSGGGVDAQTGRWTIPALPSGTWQIVGQSFAQQTQLMGKQTVTVNGSEVANVPLVLQPGTVIPVHLVTSADNNNNNVQLRLYSDAMAGDSPLGRPNEYFTNTVESPGPPGRNNRPEFSSVAPGHYRLGAQVFGNACLDSVQLGGADIRHDGITVSEGGTSAPLDVTLRNDCASVQVRINKQEGLQQVCLLLLSDDPMVEPPVTNTVSGSESSLSNLPPGTYHLYAFDSVDELEYKNPETMKAFTAQDLTLAPNQSAEVTIDVISRPANGTH